ncbi:class I SAM-dependent RNA methyltransferase [Acetobacteraceae bacterium H6797]|nr:class I SAM-dependent RNA methyltransferase [Acetobacteraceae bacterium H6797]
MPSTPEKLIVNQLGAGGDGLVRFADGTHGFVPFTLAGEHIVARRVARRGDGWLAEAEAVEQASPERIRPACPHFGPCGGCALQHWAPAPAAIWKRARLVEALARAGYPDVPVADTITSPPGSRRRADLAIRRQDGAIRLGLHERIDPKVIVDIADACPILAPRLENLLAPLKEMLRRLTGLRKEGSAVLNLLDSGPDLLLRTDAELTVPDRQILARFGTDHGLPRIAWAKGEGPSEPAAQNGEVRHMLSGHAVTPAPGAFMQATPQGEAAIIEAVLAGLPKKLSGRARIADLYAGMGTLSFPLAQRGRVTAIEGEAHAVAALQAASGATRISAERRDLARRPLAPAELKDFAAVVVDPPYAGAAEQIALLARSTVPAIVYVSCNPAALSRDAKMLQAASWKAVSAVPIDQFPWSSHLESVVAFTR